MLGCFDGAARAGGWFYCVLCLVMVDLHPYTPVSTPRYLIKHLRAVAPRT